MNKLENSTGCRPEIAYPCPWQYKLVSTEESIDQLVAKVMENIDYILTPSKKSSSGKYHSFNLEIVVESEEARNFYYATFSNEKTIKMVI